MTGLLSFDTGTPTLNTQSITSFFSTEFQRKGGSELPKTQMMAFQWIKPRKWKQINTEFF